MYTTPCVNDAVNHARILANVARLPMTIWRCLSVSLPSVDRLTITRYIVQRFDASPPNWPESRPMVTVLVDPAIEGAA